MACLFVFGTLKRGFPLHELGLRGASFLGLYRTIIPYPMMVAGPWYAPMMLNRPGFGKRVMGELYRVDSRADLTRLDNLESIGKPGNLRISVQVEPVAGGPRQSAMVYMKSPGLADPVWSPYLADYQDSRFIPPWER